MEDKIEYLENLRIQQLRTQKESIFRTLRKEIGLELLGLEDIAETLPESKELQIKRRVDRIRKILNP